MTVFAIGSNPDIRLTSTLFVVLIEVAHMYDRILLPTDGSDGAKQAVEHAFNLTDTYGATIHILYVVDQRVISGDMDIGLLTDEFEQRGHDIVEDLVEQAENEGLTVRGSVIRGIPHQAILEYAGEQDIDLIVMSTHGRTGLDRYLIGSVAENILRVSDVPVLMTRITESDTPIQDSNR